jgi:hypothetical protein
MWRHNLSSKIGQVPRSNVVQPWRHANNLHFDNPRIHNLSVVGTIEVPGFGRLKFRILGYSSFEGRNQFTEVEPIHFEEDFQLFLGEQDQAPLLLFTFGLILVLSGSWFLLPN